jgi:hypothetical protein
MAAASQAEAVVLALVEDGVQVIDSNVRVDDGQLRVVSDDCRRRVRVHLGDDEDELIDIKFIISITIIITILI